MCANTANTNTEANDMKILLGPFFNFKKKFKFSEKKLDIFF